MMRRILLIITLLTLTAFGTWNVSDTFSGDLTAWTQVYGTWAISSGSLWVQTTTASPAIANLILRTVAVDSPDQYVQADITKSATDQKTVSLIMQYHTGSKAVMGSIRNVSAGNDLWQIYRWDATGSFTQLGSSVQSEFTSPSTVRLSHTDATDTYVLSLCNPTCAAKVTATDSTYHGESGQAGFRINSQQDGSVDNFVSCPLTGCVASSNPVVRRRYGQ